MHPEPSTKKTWTLNPPLKTINYKPSTKGFRRNLTFLSRGLLKAGIPDLMFSLTTSLIKKWGPNTCAPEAFYFFSLCKVFSERSVTLPILNCRLAATRFGVQWLFHTSDHSSAIWGAWSSKISLSIALWGPMSRPRLRHLGRVVQYSWTTTGPRLDHGPIPI